MLSALPTPDPMTEFKYALRRLLQQPGFALTALLTLGLCLGANLTVFAVIDAVLLQPLPYANSDRLVAIYHGYPNAGLERANPSIRNYFNRRESIAAFESVAAIKAGSEVVDSPAGSERREVMRVTPEFFATLGRSPVLGRSFVDQDMDQGVQPTVVISDHYWHQKFAAMPDVLGQSIDIGGRRHLVIGVLPPGFRYLSSAAEIFLPLVSTAEQRGLNALYSDEAQMIALLKSGVSAEQAEAQIRFDDALQSRDYPWIAEVTAAGYHATVAGLHADHVASIRPTLLLLQIGALGLLLIGSVNLLNLVMIRATTRYRDIGVRRALGAAGSHLLRQILSESLLLCAGAALIGLLLGAGGLGLLAWMGATQLPLVADIAINARVVAAALMAAVMICVLISVPVVWFNLRPRLAGMLKSESRGGSADRVTQRWRQAFIVTQIALAFVLLSSAGLLGLSLQRAMNTSPGFQADHLLTARLTLPQSGNGEVTQRTRNAQRTLQELAHLPGVRRVALSTNLPVNGKHSYNDTNAMTIPGYQPPAGISPRLHYRYGVYGDYFQAMGIELLEGRVLDADDTDSSRRVVVVDADFAQTYWPDGRAVGQRLFEGPDARADEEAFTVVGVVAPVRQTELTDGSGNGTVYFPYRYLAHSDLYLVARTAQDPQALVPGLRETLLQIEPRLVLDRVQTMDARIADTLAVRKSPALLASLFSAAALLLAGLGTFGVLSYAVAQQQREIAVRLALGARSRQIRRQFLAQGLRLLAAGSAFGLVGAWLAASAMQNLLYGVSGMGSSNLLLTALILGMVTLGACLLPALRAARISPTTVLAGQ
ncbi:MAG: ABC transporter permease [Xanthomonadales bacterium]|nr:ABC transporter permease [Xanthomonadales bacterium]